MRLAAPGIRENQLSRKLKTVLGNCSFPAAPITSAPCRIRTPCLPVSNAKAYPAANTRACILLPFNAPQIEEYLEKNLRDIPVDQALELIRSVHNLTEMAERPYTLSLITRYIPELEVLRMQGKTVRGASLYEIMVDQWLKRDQGKHQFNPTHKQLLMEHLAAAALGASGQRQWRHEDVETWLDQYLYDHPRLAGAYSTKEREVLKEDLRTATFIVRPDDERFRFAHTSLQEYFLACYLYRGLKENKTQYWDLTLPSLETLNFLGQQLEIRSAEQTRCLRTLEEILKTLSD